MMNEEFHDEEFFDTVGFGPRFVAYMIDRFILLVILLMLGNPIFLLLKSNVVAEFKDSELDSLLMIPLIFIGVLIIYILYFAFFESSKYQATPGKLAMQIKVVDYYGDRLKFGQSLGRSASKIVTNLTCYIGYLMVTWTNDEQALHDIMAKTLVIRSD